MERAEWLMNVSLAAAYERARESEEWRILYERLRELTTLITVLERDVKLLIGSQARVISGELAVTVRRVYEAVRNGDIGIAASHISDAMDRLRVLYSGVHTASFMSRTSRMIISIVLILTPLISMGLIEDLSLALALFLIVGLAVDSILLYKTKYPPYMLTIAGILGITVSIYSIQMDQVMPGLLLASGLGASSMLIDWSISSSFLKVSVAWISTTRGYR